MNRQIKFRGKRIDNGEWVTGSLIDKDYILQYIDLAESWTPLTSDHKVTCRAYAVIPETVGQYTPRKDKKGNQICEGDIVDRGRGEIFWDEKFCQFRVRWHDKTFKRIRGRGNNPDYRGGEMLFWNSEIAWEVIGNIHDNPELNPLKGERIHTMTTDPNLKAEGQEEVKAPAETEQEQEPYETTQKSEGE